MAKHAGLPNAHFMTPEAREVRVSPCQRRAGSPLSGSYPLTAQVALSSTMCPKTGTLNLTSNGPKQLDSKD